MSFILGDLINLFIFVSRIAVVSFVSYILGVISLREDNSSRSDDERKSPSGLIVLHQPRPTTPQRAGCWAKASYHDGRAVFVILNHA